MSDEQVYRNLAGLALALHREDNDAFQALRAAEEERSDGRDFHVVAFGTIVYLADRVAEIAHTTPESIVEHIRSQAGDHMMATVADCALAALAKDKERFNEIGREASGHEDFILSELHTVIWLAEQIGISEGKHAEAVLSDMAMTAAIAEADLFEE